MRNAALVTALPLFLVLGCKSTSEQGDGPTDPMDPSSGQDSATPTEQGTLTDSDMERANLLEQKERFLVESYVANARTLRDQLRLEEAESELLKALELDPDDAQARALWDEVGALLGRDNTGWQTVADQLAQEHELRVQRLRAEAQINLERGKQAFERGEYDNAIAEFTLARDHVRWSDYSIDWAGLDVEAQDWLDRSLRARTEAAEQERMQAQQEALQAMREEEQAAAAQRQVMVANVLDQGFSSFEVEDYETSYDFAQKALQIEPQNSQAIELRDASFRAARKKATKDYTRKRREQFKRWQQDLEELKIPYTDIMTLPDQEFWLDITERRAKREGIDLSQTLSAADIELRSLLTQKRVPGFIVSDEESLTEVIRQLRTLTDLPLVVDPLAETAAFDEGAVFEFDFQNPLTAEKMLNHITDQAGEEVTWTIRHDAVLVTTQEKARGKLIIYNHDVQDLIFGLTDFLGPRIDRLRLLDELEDDDGGGPFGGIGESPNIVNPDDLVTLVQENVAVGSWEDEGVNINVEVGNMIVVHTPDVQQEIRSFLNDLRRFSSSLVTIESKFLNVEDNWIQEIGVDWRGVDNPGVPFTDLDDVTNGLEDMASLGLDNNGTGFINDAAGPPSSGFYYADSNGDYKGRSENFFLSALGDALSTVGGLTAQWTLLDDRQFSMILRMVEKSQQMELINDQVLSVHNTQRAFVNVVNQRAYIQDFDVEVAQAQSIADPQINVLHEGIVLDVRPTIHQDRKYLTLEIQPTVARVVSLTDFSTSLGSATSPVTFQLPELEVQSVFTTAVVPDGGSILIGGLSRIRNVERRAEVPWLANIPLVGFFFKSEGYSDEKASLMILIKAWITDVKDEIAKFESQ